MKKLALVLAIAAGCRATGESVPEGPGMNKLTPVLTVDEIEPSLTLWDRLEFERTTEVPGDAGLAFVSLERGGVEIMYQTRESLRADLPAIAAGPFRSVLFIEIDSIDDVESRLEGVDVVVPRRETFYGSTEVCIREPGGHLVIFAELSSVQDG